MNDLVMLSTDWDRANDPTGFWLSEKLDGVLALWDGEKFLSRAGNVIKAPKWFTEHLPQDRLVGELWAGRGKFPHVLSVIRRARPSDVDWARMTYRLFDAPDFSGTFEQRLYYLCQTSISISQSIAENGSRPWAPKESHVSVIKHVQCTSELHLMQFHAGVVSAGGEGTMLRRPGSLYRVGRSKDCLRLKDWITEEARVVGHNFNPDGFRSLVCELISDPAVRFDVGSGLDARQVQNPPAIGTILTVKFKEKLASGSLREPTIVCVRDYE